MTVHAAAYSLQCRLWTHRNTSGCTESEGPDVLSTKAVLRKQRNVREARIDRLNANTAFSRDKAVFIFLAVVEGQRSMHASHVRA